MDYFRHPLLALSMLGASAALSAAAFGQQDPFSPSERWTAAPAAGDWMPDDTRFAGDDSFVWTSLRGGTHTLMAFDAVAAGAQAPRGVVSRAASEFGAALIAAGERGDAVFSLRQFEAPTVYERAPIVEAFDPSRVDGGGTMTPVWVHDMGVRINGPVRLASDRQGDVVVGAAWDHTTARARIDLLNGTNGALLGRADLPAVSLNALEVSRDGSRVAAVCGTTLHVLDGTGASLHTEALTSTTMALDLSADGRTIAYGELGAMNVLSDFGGGYVTTLHRTGSTQELPSAIALSDDGSLIATAWWNFNNGLDARVEIFDTIFQFPLAEMSLPAPAGSNQNLPVAARISADGHRAAFGLWGNGSDPEVIVLEAAGFGPALVADVPGSVRGLDLDATGTRVVFGHKDVHSQVFGSSGSIRLVDSGERNLQLLETPRIGTSIRAVAQKPGAFGGWFILGPEATIPTQFPGAIGPLLLQRNRLAVYPRATDASGRIDLTLPLPNSAALVGRQMHLQAAFRTTQGLEFTPHLVSPFVVR